MSEQARDIIEEKIIPIRPAAICTARENPSPEVALTVEQIADRIGRYKLPNLVKAVRRRAQMHHSEGREKGYNQSYYYPPAAVTAIVKYFRSLIYEVDALSKYGYKNVKQIADEIELAGVDRDDLVEKIRKRGAKMYKHRRIKALTRDYYYPPEVVEEFFGFYTRNLTNKKRAA